MAANWQKYLEYTTQPDCVTIRGYAEGAGAADMTIIEGTGVTLIDYLSSAGLFTFYFDRGFKKLVEWHFGFGADTAANVKGFTCVIDVDAVVLTPPAATVNIAITNASETLENLDADEFLSFSFTFALTDRDK